jgi:hypothetical protein
MRDASVDRAMALTRALDAPGLDDVLRRAVARLGVPGFLEHVVTPLVRDVDEAWRAGRLGAAQERLAASTVHDLLVETMRALARGHARGDTTHRLVLATPPGASAAARAVAAPGTRSAPGVAAVEAAAAGAAAAADGWGVVYLGPTFPPARSRPSPRRRPRARWPSTCPGISARTATGSASRARSGRCARGSPPRSRCWWAVRAPRSSRRASPVRASTSGRAGPIFAPP